MTDAKPPIDPKNRFRSLVMALRYANYLNQSGLVANDRHGLFYMYTVNISDWTITARYMNAGRGEKSYTMVGYVEAPILYNNEPCRAEDKPDGR